MKKRTRHLAIDLQRLFAEDHGWHVPGIASILPNVLRLTQAHQTIFTRFVTPATPDAARGQWQALYAAWPQVTGLDLDILNLVPALRGLGAVVDKTTYSAFPALILPPEVDTLILSGAETDACVLATLLGAVDLGLRVVVAVDAVTSSDMAAHHAILDLLARRLPQQVTLAPTSEILRTWA
ncbi:cysteine hydrolase [Rhodobacter sp. KR11]|uniref:cysteine hydrolase family protein n=1 Tax=Rhodobacter sp. KR11 TaxID=2974588 RepID=UPI00222140F7|nr:cysteine hydrolase [Rhodobacter sp. KR11]MCW1920285.1 cysteine hydrolase [Rhodobacter sp. KR11]